MSRWHLTIKNLSRIIGIIVRFEETGTIAEKPGRSHKPFRMQRAEDIGTAVVLQATTNASCKLYTLYTCNISTFEYPLFNSVGTLF